MGFRQGAKIWYVPGYSISLIPQMFPRRLAGCDHAPKGCHCDRKEGDASDNEPPVLVCDQLWYPGILQGIVYHDKTGSGPNDDTQPQYPHREDTLLVERPPITPVDGEQINKIENGGCCQNKCHGCQDNIVDFGGKVGGFTA